MANESSFALRKQMLEDRIRKISTDLGIPEDKAFMRLTYELLFDTQYDDPDYDTDLVDGGGDKQIDIIRIEESQGQATIHLVQVKNSGTYAGKVVVQMRDALSWIFERPEEQYSKITNKDFVLKISEIRELSGRLGLRNLSVFIHYVAKGDANRLSPDFTQEIQNTESLYADSDEFNSFEFKVWGVNELINRLYEIEQEKSRIDVDLKYFSLWNIPTYLQYTISSIKSVICTVDGSEIAGIVRQYGLQLFEENVRTYLGINKINKDIFKTCTDSSEAEYFWFFNNGITVTCDSFDIVFNANPAVIKISNIQIVNGCQTSMTLNEAANAGKLEYKTKVLLKVFATQDKQFVDRITLTTNRQNAVDSRDLSSNDQIQRDLGDLFKSRGYYYERKPGQFKDLLRNERKRMLSNEKVGQSHLAIVEHLPATAMSQRSKIWSSSYYEDVFGSRVEELTHSFPTRRSSDLRSKALRNSAEGIDEAILKYGNFHLARVIGSLLVGEDWHQCSTQKLGEVIRDIEQTPNFLIGYYDQARIILRQIVDDLSEKDTTKIINIFKSDKIQQKLDSFRKKAQ